MRRLLLVAYHFPPNPAVGARRPSFLARFLSEFGWEVTVLTRPQPALPSFPCRIVTAPVLGERFEAAARRSLDASASPELSRTDGRLRSVLQRVRENVLFPDNLAPWIPGAIASGLRVARREHFDAVLSTAMPASVHVVGAAIAGATHLPWIADYRDPWTGNAYATRSPLRTRLERALERRLIRGASAVTTVNEPIARQLERLHDRPVGVIPNAIDAEDWQGERGEPSGFTFRYTGSMYDGQRSPDLFFEAIARLRDRRHPAGTLRAEFLGPNCEGVAASVKRYGLENNVRYLGVVPRKEAIEAQRSASHLLMFLNFDPATTTELGSKILEYCGAKRPIVAFGPSESVVRNFIEDHRIGWFASTVDEAMGALQDAYDAYVAKHWTVEPPANEFIDGRGLAKAFARRLNAFT